MGERVIRDGKMWHDGMSHARELGHESHVSKEVVPLRPLPLPVATYRIQRFSLSMTMPRFFLNLPLVS